MDEYQNLLPLPRTNPIQSDHSLHIVAISHKKKDDQLLYVGLDEKDDSNNFVQSWVYILPNNLMTFTLPPDPQNSNFKTFPIEN